MVTRIHIFAAVVLLGGLAAAVAAQSAREITRTTGIDRGLAVVIARDTKTAQDLAETGRMVVHLLVPDTTVEQRREEVIRAGLGGRVLVDRLPKDHLPHPSRFVNLVVADLDAAGNRAPSAAELQRVLAVRGATYLKQNGTWQAASAQPDDRIDGWSHRWYDASGNCVSRDRVAGYPQAVQWQHGPAMEDGTGDGKVPRVADGRVVTLDHLSGDLVCRDAGNGTLLWRRFIGSRHNSDLAIVGGKIYLWHDPNAKPEQNRKAFEERGPLVAFSLATGEQAETFEHGLIAGSAQPIEYVRPRDNRRFQRRPVPWFVVRDDVIVQAYGHDLVVLDRATGRRQWSQKLRGDATWFAPTLAEILVLAAEAVHPARRGRYDGTEHVRCVTAFDLRTGKTRWRNESLHPQREVEEKSRRYQARAEFKPPSVANGLVLLHTSSYQFRQGGSIAVLDLGTGREKWRRNFAPKELYTQGSQRAVLRDGEVIVLDGTGAYRFDAQSGQPRGEPIQRPRVKRLARNNGACTASRATVNWLICNAYLYVGPNGEVRDCFGARGQCGEGVVPANGLIFVPPTACDCGDYTRGLQALTPSLPGKPFTDEQRLTQGPAYGQLEANKPYEENAWPVFLGQPQRLSHTDDAIQLPLKQVWQRKAASVRQDAVDRDRRDSERYLGALSAPVVADGRLVVAAPETHQVLCFDAATGRQQWGFATGGKVDSPPTLAARLAVFGCEDGSVYAVRLSDGKLNWRFRAAPTDGVAMHHGHLAAAFPLPGSVLILQDRVIAIAGHHTDIDGLHLWALDLPTGKPLTQRVIRQEQPAVVTNGIPVADADLRGFWLGLDKSPLHLSFDLKDLPTGSDAPGPPIAFDRNGTRIRFRTDEGRGGSTHSWKQAMRCGWARAHRIARDGETIFALNDPTEGDRHPVRADKVAVVTAGTGNWRDKRIVWETSVADLGNKPSYSALIQAGKHLILGGGSRSGDSGFAQVLDAASGKLLASYDLPARVTECGLAAAGGSLYICCEDGHLVCLSSDH